MRNQFAKCRTCATSVDLVNGSPVVKLVATDMATGADIGIFCSPTCADQAPSPSAEALERARALVKAAARAGFRSRDYEQLRLSDYR